MGRQTEDINLISEVLSDSFNVIVKSLCYTLFTFAILFVISPQLVLVFFSGLFVLSIVAGGLRRVTTKLDK